MIRINKKTSESKKRLRPRLSILFTAFVVFGVVPLCFMPARAGKIN